MRVAQIKERKKEGRKKKHLNEHAGMTNAAAKEIAYSLESIVTQHNNRS
jgi:hypothetical protein